MSISTRKGDQGETDLLFGCRIRKDDPQMAAIGDVDELNAALGLFRVCARHEIAQRELPLIQRTLIQLMGELALPSKCGGDFPQDHPVSLQYRIEHSMVSHLDELVQALESLGALEIKDWAIPGSSGVMSSAHADMARTVCRRAERSVIGLSKWLGSSFNPSIMQYLNRLSDVLWLMARMEEKGQQSESEMHT